MTPLECLKWLREVWFDVYYPLEHCVYDADQPEKSVGDLVDEVISKSRMKAE